MDDLFLFAEANANRDRGMAKVASRHPDFQEAAYRALVALAERQEFVHIDDFLRVFTRQPSHPNEFGPVWGRAQKDGVLVPTDRSKRSTDPKKNAHRYPIYRSLVWRAVPEKTSSIANIWNAG